MPIKLLIADDHVFYREGVRALLASSPEITIVGEASTGEEAIARAAEVTPQVILMDLKMPGMNGIDATRRIHETSPDIGVLVITMFDDDDSVFAAMRAGARGYLLKDADRDELVRGIAAVEKGEAIFSPAIAQRMIQYFSASPGRRSKEGPGEFAGLTERELEILDLISRAITMPRSPTGSRSASRPCRTVSPSISHQAQVATAPGRSSAPARPASEERLGGSIILGCIRPHRVEPSWPFESYQPLSAIFRLKETYRARTSLRHVV
jgi:DNA-binding NarL/FixJ family response regulator